MPPVSQRLDGDRRGLWKVFSEFTALQEPQLWDRCRMPKVLFQGMLAVSRVPLRHRRYSACRTQIVQPTINIVSLACLPSITKIMKINSGMRPSILITHWRLSYQLFIEPKGKHIADGDRWKEEFLQDICAEFPSRFFTEDSKYRIIGVPSFYNEDHENQFRDNLDNALEVIPNTKAE